MGLGAEFLDEVEKGIDVILDASDRWSEVEAGICKYRIGRFPYGLLYRQLARLRTDVPLTETLDDLRWQGSRRGELESVCAEIGETDIAARMPLWRES